MSKTVVVLFKGADQAKSALDDLKRNGFSNAETYGTAAGRSAGSSDLTSSLTSAGVPKTEAEEYAEEVRHGGSLVLVSTSDTEVDKARNILEKHTSPGANAGTRSTPGANRATGTTKSPGRGAGQVKEDIVEEQINIGKRQVERPGARIYTRMTERPVEEQVNLREEHVRVEKRPANRPASEADLRGGEDIEVTARSEEPVVGKQARVVGEVVVTKEAHQRSATVRDKVRRKEVEVERGPGERGGVTGTTGYQKYESAFREHHRKHDKSGMDYEDAAPAYRYGADIAETSRFKDKDWSSARSEIHSQWERYNPDTWDEAEPAIRFGWDKVHGKA